MGIVEFLEARITEDEAVALKAGGGEAEWLYRAEYDRETGNEVVWANSRSEKWFGPAQKEPLVTYDRYVTMDHEGCLPAVDEDDGPHIARHDPARILREVAASREVLRMRERSFEASAHEETCFFYVAALDAVIANLATAFSDHPDFDEEWRP